MSAPNIAAYELAVGNDRAVRLLCGCGEEETYDSFKAFVRAWDSTEMDFICRKEYDWAPALDTEAFYLKCPTCSTDGAHATIEAFQTANETIVLSTVPLRQPTGFGVDSGVDADDLGCPACESSLSAADKRADPHAPAVGYDYYECPECGHRMRPERVEGANAGDAPTPDSDRSDDGASDAASFRDGLSSDLQTVYDSIDENAENGEPADRADVIDDISVVLQVTPDEADALVHDLLQKGGCYEPDDRKLHVI